MRGRILPLLPGAIPAAGEIILLSHMNSRAMALPHPASAHANDICLGACGTATCPNAKISYEWIMCILGAHTAFTVCCRSPRPGYHTTGEIPWRPMVLWMVVCRVSAVPNSPPGTTTEPPCCHCQNFLQILLLKEFSSFSLSGRRGSLPHGKQGGIVSRPFRVYTRSVHSPDPSFDLRHRDTVLCDQESHCDFPLFHIELPSALFFL